MKVIVLMSTYNGEKYLETQLESILAQEGVNIDILVRDDGSKDSTHIILDNYQREGKLHWYTGDNLKPARSFMNLVQNAPDADYYAFSDQDDYWEPDKILTAIKQLNSFDQDKPSLYYSRYTMVDKDLKKIPQGKDKLYVSLTMKQAVVSSAATGCTMVFNKCLLNYLKLKHPSFQIMHDNWVHKVCVALGGNLYFDETSHILYRQHGNNAIGGDTNLRKRLKRHINTAFKDPCYRSKSIIALYKCYGEYMPVSNRKICHLVCNYHKGLNRFKLAFDRGYRTQNKRINLIFVVATLLGVF